MIKHGDIYYIRDTRQSIGSEQVQAMETEITIVKAAFADLRKRELNAAQTRGDL